jgi:hypothetical protein
MGSPDARAYSRNKRGIAGSLIWINFDRHSLLNLIQQCAGTFVADIDEIRPQYTSTTNGGAVFQSSLVRSAGIPVSATIDQLDTQTLSSAGQNVQLASPWYSDQVLPFDVTLSGANEYGAMCAAKIYGLEILNEGFGISIDDAVSEMQARPGPSVGIPISPPSGTAPINDHMMPVNPSRTSYLTCTPSWLDSCSCLVPAPALAPAPKTAPPLNDAVLASRKLRLRDSAPL